MKPRFRVVSDTRDVCELCKKRGDAVFVDSYSPRKYRAYVCYDCIKEIVEVKRFAPVTKTDQLPAETQEEQKTDGKQRRKAR